MKQELGPLGSADFLTAKELRQELSDHLASMKEVFYRADKYMRIPLVTGTAVAGNLTIKSTVGPYQGYAWDIAFIGVAGLTGGGTPDVVQLLFDGGPQYPWWVFTGAAPNYLQRFSRGQMVMLPGETITLQSVGTFAATGPITLYGAIRTETPAVKLGSILA